MDLRQNLMTDRVTHLQPGEVPCVSPSTPISAVLAEMRRLKAGCVLICEGSRLLGIFTERDALRIIVNRESLQAAVSTVMTSQPATITEQDTVARAVQLMHGGGYRRLPLVNAQGEPTAAVVGVKDVVHYLVEHFPSSVYNLPPVAEPTTRDREGA